MSFVYKTFYTGCGWSSLIIPDLFVQKHALIALGNKSGEITIWRYDKLFLCVYIYHQYRLCMCRNYNNNNNIQLSSLDSYHSELGAQFFTGFQPHQSFVNLVEWSQWRSNDNQR